MLLKKLVSLPLRTGCRAQILCVSCTALIPGAFIRWENNQVTAFRRRVIYQGVSAGDPRDKRIVELEDQLAQRNREISSLKATITELTAQLEGF